MCEEMCKTIKLNRAKVETFQDQKFDALVGGVSEWSINIEVMRHMVVQKHSWNNN